MYAFISQHGRRKGPTSAVNGAMEAIVRWDPQSATEAELRTMEQHLDELGQQVAKARQGYDKEQREADAIQTLSKQRMAAAEQIQHQMDTAGDATQKTALEKSLTTLITMLEGMSADVEREKQGRGGRSRFSAPARSCLPAGRTEA